MPIFLKLDGITGASIDKVHAGEIDVQSFSFGAGNTATRTGTVVASGKVSLSDVEVSMVGSKAGPQLLLACATGRHIANGALSIRASGATTGDYLVYTLSDVLVTQYQISGSGGESPVESLGLNFGRIVVEYKDQRPDGSLGASTKAGWDVARAMPV
jgi:type VI secretion system secreted protein Hcp